MQHSSSHRRRKKQRSNLSPKLRTVEVNRSYNGFGFTISGQQPCILSCIVPNSPADLAGLRAGNFLISVNSTNVSKLHHEAIVQLIGNSCGTVRLQIAENYFSDSSDDENSVHSGQTSISTVHTTPTNRRFSSHHKTSRSRHKISPLPADVLPLHPVIEDLPVMAAHDIIHSPNASTSSDVTNVSAMVRVGVSLEYRVILGYLGTIEMPKQIATSSKLQTVRSCIRKLRQEKRNPTTVLMTILPNCLILRSEDSQILATLPSSRLNYVSSSSESENRFFGLVTSTIFSEDDSENEGAAGGSEISISSSCHVFVVDPKICEHSVHEIKARDFNIDCTKDPISNLCLEFPNNSEYVVNLIRSMYTMRVFPNSSSCKPIQNDQNFAGGHSPLPSNHSEITTTSSNSDSGIGFHNDMAHISDKILLVDFPAKERLNVRALPHASPMGSAKSMDNGLNTSGDRDRYRRSVQYAIDDIAIHTTPKSTKDHVFLMPADKPMRNKMRKMDLDDKFSPQVYQTPEKKENLYLELWGSLHNIHRSEFFVEDGEEENVVPLEGAYSVPDLTSRALPSNSSPFKRWGQSSFRAPRVTEPLQSLTRRPSSLVASENDVYTKSMDAMMIDGLTPLENSTKCANRKISAPCRTLNGNSNTVDIEGGGGVLTWGTSFEKLLEDPAGMNTFAEFLKKEYSAENIYFWAACERYRQIDNDSERQKQAVEIFSKHLSNGAMEPVNVDSHARNFAQQNLNGADRTLFNLAQKQIFHLMKFDSYQRFIRSDLYKKCLDCYQKKLPLPYPGEQLDELLRTGNEIPGPPKLKKSASNAEDRRRKSLLPWHRKTRCKSRDRTEPPIIELQKSKSSTAIKSTFGNTLKLPNSGSSDIHSSRSSLSSFDTNFQEEHQRKISISNGACTLCKVILSDGATTVVQTNATETVRQLVERLLEKRGLNYSFYDVYIRDTNQLVNLQESSAILAKNTVYVEQIVAFKLVLPNSKHISVKCKPKKVLSEVLTPILHKYNYRMEDVVKIVIKDSQKELELSVPVTNVDGHRLQVHMTKMLQSNGVGAGGVPQQPQHTLDEITNKVFNELLKEKVDNNGNSHQGMDQGLAGTTEVDNQSMKSEDCISESSSLFDRIRRKDTTNIPVLRSNRQKKVVISNNHKLVISASEELNGNHIPVEKIREPLPTPPAPLSSSSSLTTTTGTATGLATGTPSMSSTAANQKPLIAKWKTGAKLQCTERTEKQGEEFIEGLKRAQKARLEDQRGVEINFELPDFLKNNENISAANKLRKIRANLSPISRQQSTESTKSTNNPVPAPRLSLTKATMPTILDLTAIEKTTTATPVLPTVPPPLPPKPKVLPAKPSNWGQNTSNSSTNSNISLLSTASSASNSSNSSSSSSSGPVISNSPSSTTKILNDIKRHQAEQQNGSAYLDQPSSSFV